MFLSCVAIWLLRVPLYWNSKFYNCTITNPTKRHSFTLQQIIHIQMPSATTYVWLKTTRTSSQRYKIPSSTHQLTWTPVISYIKYHQHQYCKILHEGTLLQPWPSFSENNVIPSPYLNEDLKKKSSPKIEVFFPQNQVKTKKKKTKKRSSPKIEVFFFRHLMKTKKKGLHRNLGLYSARICRICSCWMALVCLIIQRSNLDGWTSKSRWGDANSRWGDARPPYNLSTDQH